MAPITINQLLTTTRTVRKRLDLTRPVEPDVIQQCLDLAIQAPIGGHIPRYHFVVVTDQDKRAALAALYKQAYFELYMPQRNEQNREENSRLLESATYLAEHLHEVPVHIIPCIESRVEDKGCFRQATIYRSILPVMGVSCLPHGRLCWHYAAMDWARHGQLYIFCINKKRRTYWVFPVT